MGNIRNTAATNENLQNLSGRAFSENVAAKGTTTLKNIIPAGRNQYFPEVGDFFYIEAASGQINISPDCAYGKGPENPYVTGTGMRFARVNNFHGLQIRNPDPANALFFQIKIGFDEFIDNRLVYPDLLFKQVSKNTYFNAAGTAGPGAPSALVTITDLSGTIIIDDNGNRWYAVNRQLLELYNTDSNDYWILMNTAGNIFEAAVHPLQSIQRPVSGNFTLFQGSHVPVDGIITEIYNCLPQLGF